MRPPDIFRRNKSGLVIAVLEHLVDRRKHARRGAKRCGKPNMGEGLRTSRKPAVEFSPHLVEHQRRGALEGKDRLLFVTDREERSRAAALSLPGREIAGELFENSPLRLARILRLVDQDMIDSRIQSIEHPARIGALEQG